MATGAGLATSVGGVMFTETGKHPKPTLHEICCLLRNEGIGSKGTGAVNSMALFRMWQGLVFLLSIRRENSSFVMAEARI